MSGSKAAEFEDASGTTYCSKFGSLIPRGVDELEFYRGKYFEIQSLENHPDLLPQASRPLDNLLLEAQAIEQISASGKKLFQARQAAERWLRQKAPIKLIDGAWLGTHQSDNYAICILDVDEQYLASVVGGVRGWRLESNHIHLYQQILQDMGCSIPDANTVESFDPQHEMGNIRVWKTAVAQLLISLFPNEHLLDILGFKLHLKRVTMETIKAARELPTFGIKPSYFLLHIFVDNADSGHIAMAMDTVIQYMNLLERVEGMHTVHKAWKRV
ncbi:hypothetical protein K431DRAFT_298566 [Polychaeton citri CBS 116435]|uniref:Uncharacterized protein n=1 Tax=Polychaeton citri CBS 116435 TaxID=1314669 RepID=A0A9P4PZB0_9PEZI|nr:hypothetical protein K431DRAFT_298566 [Polychaeton citri CBS 116435]